MKTLYTYVSDDYYQYYIPMFIWSARKLWPDRIIIETSSINELIRKVVENDCTIVESKNYPKEIGTYNALRFTSETPTSQGEVLITDVDFFFCPTGMDVFNYYKNTVLPLMPNDCYVGHHGPWKKPHRPEICKEWRGEWERIGGGFVLFFPEWWEKTRKIRERWDKKLRDRMWGHFRESDEVMLARIVKEAGLPVAPKIPFPRPLRHLHFGDFKEDMEVRYTDKAKMNSLLDVRCAKYFIKCLDNPEFKKILSVCRENKTIDGIIDRTIKYCEGV